jgi:hypothetical protein
LLKTVVVHVVEMVQPVKLVQQALLDRLDILVIQVHRDLRVRQVLQVKLERQVLRDPLEILVRLDLQDRQVPQVIRVFRV